MRKCEDRCKIVVQLKDAMLKLADTFLKVPKAYSDLWRAQHEERRCKETFLASDIELQEAERAFEELENQCREARNKANEYLAKAREAGEPTDEEKEQFEEFPDTIQDIDDMLTRERTRAQMNMDVDERVITLYQTRATEIERIEKEADTKRGELTDCTEKLEATRQDWEPKVDQLIIGIADRFSTYFKSIGCAGDVRLAKEHQYDQWGIEILVKFRDAEQLAPLTPHRQSGGERSVSIMMYLMALQHFSKAPFRVVDEINQGMDPRNERLIHSQMVKTVCEYEESQAVVGRSQYFLITPKLLPDLEYHPLMKVLVIYNGENVLEEWE